MDPDTHTKNTSPFIANITSIMARIIIAILLLWAAAASHSDDYYTILRWATCSIGFYTAFLAYKGGKPGWIWIFIPISLLFNPIKTTELDEETWTLINAGTSILFILSVFIITERPWRKNRSHNCEPSAAPESLPENQTEQSCEKIRGISRGGYLISLPVFMFLAWLLGPKLENNIFAIALFFIPYLLFIIGRLHNIGKSGWLSLFALLPLTNVAIILMCVAYQENYEITKKLDKTGKTIEVIILAMLLAMLAVVGFVWTVGSIYK